MSKQIEVKSNMHCEKCRTDVLKSVTKLSGIDKISVDLEKQMLVIVGDVDPVSVVERVKKTGKRADVVYVGPPKTPDPPPNKCDDTKMVYSYPICPDIYPICPNVYPVCPNVYPAYLGYPPPCPCETGGCMIF